MRNDFMVTTGMLISVITLGPDLLIIFTLHYLFAGVIHFLPVLMLKLFLFS
jgi:hypothetical protein